MQEGNQLGSDGAEKLLPALANMSLLRKLILVSSGDLFCLELLMLDARGPLSFPSVW